MYKDPENKPEKQSNLESEAYNLRLELYYFKNYFKNFTGTSGCVHVKLNKLWIYFLSISNAGIYIFILHYIFSKQS